MALCSFSVVVKCRTSNLRVMCTTHAIKCIVLSTILGQGYTEMLNKKVESVESNVQYTSYG